MTRGSAGSFEATVDPELLVLLGRRAPDPHREAAAPVGPQPPCTAGGQESPDLPWGRISLRCDGKPPLSFTGVEILACDAEAGDPQDGGCSAKRLFRLYLSYDQRLIAHLAVLPHEGLPARPIHRADYLAEPDELTRFLTENDPSDCALARPTQGADGQLDALWMALRLSLPLAAHCCARPSLHTDGGHS
ncbi:hypothetical protein [Cereibacter sphaeroides]|uniref:hypothetical protein n=1 Tax=Cereibacter sphaeroides TaxID=1063 RepID=UPI000191C900|nr:hypothetical protein [Cereibacter sphaeroides]ACM02995.1 Hypothetical Protein RSKD131_3135 [Cereibacter sphaeroides KD131]RHZ92857.1 hypothetical protein D1122_19000 [Cereibacter sphaeroides]